MADLASVELTHFAEEAKKAARSLIELGVSATKAEKVTSDFNGEILRIKKVFDDLYPITTRTQKEWDLYNQALERANANHKTTVASMGALGTAIDHTQKRQNKLGTAFNQASFQVNDFFVQVSSGTNALVAFGQQGAQAAQILTMFGGPIAVIGAVLAVAIPVLTTIARSMGVFGDAAVDAARKAEGAFDKIKKTFGELKKLSELRGLATGFTDLGAVLDNVANVQLKGLDIELRKTFGTNASWYGVILNLPGAIGRMLQTNKWNEFTRAYSRAYGVTSETALDFLREVEKANVTVLDQKAEELNLLIEGNKIKETEEAFLARAIVDRAKILQSQKESLNTTLDDLKYQAALSQMEAKGIDTGRVKLAHAQEELVTKLKALEATDEQIKRGTKYLEQAYENEKLAEKAKKDAEAKRKEEERLKQVKVETLGLEIQALKKSDLTAETKADILEKEMQRFLLQKGITAEVDKQTEAEKKLLAAKFKALDISLAGTRSGEKGGGKKAVKDPLGDELKANDKLIKQANVKALFAKDTWDYYSRMLAIQTDGTIVGDKRLGQLKSQYEELKKINEALEFRKELQDALVKSAYDLGEGIGSAFAKMGEGKSTMDKIGIFIKEITKAFLATELAVLAFTTLLTALSVPKDIAGALAGQIVMAGAKALEFANGGVFDQGVQKFANGGVVSQPTYFNMGLMGEAGPEAIMPLKRGRDGKLGVAANDNGGAVTVVQNFSFSANGDESVKKIIAQEAPKIAQLAQRVIIDNRRRGGATRGAFA